MYVCIIRRTYPFTQLHGCRVSFLPLWHVLHVAHGRATTRERISVNATELRNQLSVIYPLEIHKCLL